MTGNGTYKITEAASMPEGKTPYGEFVADILLRLEKTPLPRALKVEFQTPARAKGAQRALLNHCTRSGVPEYIKTKVQKECLYVQRGERWVKPD